MLGTERHESRRIDNQLRGRSGRQGDPGESRFYLSLEDDLMRLFNSGLAMRVMDSASFPDDMPLEHKFVSRGIASAQAQIEARNFEIRKNVLKYDDVMSRQREIVYAERRRVLEGEDLQQQIQAFLDDVVAGLVSVHTAQGAPETWDLEALWTELKTTYPVSITPEDVVEEAGNATRVTAEMLTEELQSDIHLAYAAREEELGSEVMRQLERRVVLSVLDRKWREHLYEMDYLKEGIGLRAMAQRDPLVEYQTEGYQLFQAMNEAIKEEAVQYLFNLEVKRQEAPSTRRPSLSTTPRPRRPRRRRPRTPGSRRPRPPPRRRTSWASRRRSGPSGCRTPPRRSTAPCPPASPATASPPPRWPGTTVSPPARATVSSAARRPRRRAAGSSRGASAPGAEDVTDVGPHHRCGGARRRWAAGLARRRDTVCSPTRRRDTVAPTLQRGTVAPGCGQPWPSSPWGRNTDLGPAVGPDVHANASISRGAQPCSSESSRSATSRLTPPRARRRPTPSGCGRS